MKNSSKNLVQSETTFWGYYWILEEFNDDGVAYSAKAIKMTKNDGISGTAEVYRARE